MSLIVSNTIPQTSSSTVFNQFLTDSISYYADDRIRDIPSYMLQEHKNLEIIYLPNAITLVGTAFEDCNNLTSLLIRANITNNSLYQDVPKLTHFILNDDNIVSPYIPIRSIGSEHQSPLLFNIGGFYVSQRLVNDYKNATNWSVCSDMIYSLNDYHPYVIHFNDTISDSWSQIAASEDENSYKTKYHIGDTKTIEINGTYCKMQIIAFDKDIINNNNEDRAKITWMSKYLYNGFYNTAFHQNTTNTNSFYNSIGDSTLKQLIKNVKKPTFYKTSTQTFNLNLWVLSGAELGLQNYIEREGVEPYSIFTDNNSRILPTVYFGSNTPMRYRTRSSYSETTSLSINTDGTATQDNALTSYRYGPFGFCT